MKKNFTKNLRVQLFVPRNLFLVVGLCAMLLIIGAHPSSAQFSQNSKITLELDNVSIKDVIEKIKNQSKYTFFIDADDVDLNRRISIDLVDKSINEILDAVVAGQKISYKINGKRITLVSKEAENGSKLTISAEKGKISGIVKDQTGESLIGATIMVKGTTIGVISDIDGNYSIDVPENSTLVFSFIGYISQEMEVSQQSVINVTLQEDNELLDEVVVIGFGTQKKVNLTGAVTSVKMSDALGDRPITNISNALQSVVPGLQITSTKGTPGESPDFNIRGTTSINGGEPLVLVNNVPMSMDMIDPQDVESISILKDAASAAIYGARAAFGVILITTKQGKKGSKPVFNYNNNFSFSSPAELPQKASPLEAVQAYQQMEFPNGNYVDGSNLDQWEEYILEYLDDPSKYPGGYTRDESGKVYQLGENDYFDDMMEDYGFVQNHSLSVSGGSDNSTYRVGVSYTGEDGILITDKDTYDRINITSFVGIDLNKWLTTQLDVKYANANESIVEVGGRGGIWASGLKPSFRILEDQVIDGIFYPMESPATYIEMGEPRTINTQNIRALGRFIVKPVKNLKIIGEYTFDRRSTVNKLYTNKYDYVGFNLEQIRENVSNSKYETTQGFTNYSAINLFGNYTLELGENSFDFMAGYNQEFSHFENQKSTKTDVFISNLPSLGTASGTTIATDSFNEYAIRGMFYRVSYNYAGKYFLEANGRYDGSSRFPEESRFGFFPSFSGAYRISEEKFMDPLRDIITNLKFRASWGSIGNQVVGNNYPYIATMSPNLSNWLVDGLKVTTLKQPAMVSSSFAWERVETLNLAVDFDLFNNRLNSTLEWYQRDTKGMLAPGMELPGVVGADAAQQNAADLRTEGWEISLSWRDKIEEFSYRIGFNLYDSKSVITKYDNQVGLFTADNSRVTAANKRYREGMDIGEIWGYTTDRIATEDDFNGDGSLKDGIPLFQGQSKLNPGDIIYKNFDEDTKYIFSGDNTESNPGDQKIIGNTTPRYQYGINAGASYKGFDISILLRGVGKRDFWRTDQAAWPTGGWNGLFSDALDFWTPDNRDAYYPRAYGFDRVNTTYNRKVQTKYLASGSFLKIQNITLSYTLPEDITTRLHFNNIKVFVSGENLHTFDNLPEGFDPESSATWNYPFMKKYSVGLNVSF